MQATDEVPTPNGTLTLKLIAQRHDTNLHGDISGGWLMHRMDEACELAAGRVANGRTATVSVEGLDFLSPVRVGSLVNIFTRVIEIGRSSIRLSVEVWVRPPLERNHSLLTKVTEACYVMVALDDNGRIRCVPEQASDAVLQALQ